MGACATNFDISLKKPERILLFFGAAILLLIELTIAFEKHQALLFALTVLGTGLALRYTTKVLIPIPIPVVPSVNVLTVSEAKEITPLYRSSSLVAIKTLNQSLLADAALRVKALGESSLYLAYVEETPPAAELPTEAEPSPQSLELLAQAQKEMEERGITAIPVWQLGDNPGNLIANAARELGVNTVMIGTTKRSTLMNLLRGNVLRTLTKRLPRECRLVISS